MGSLMTLLTFAVVVGLATCVWLIYQPQDLSDIKGRGSAAIGRKAPNLLEVLKRAQSGVYPVTLTEEDLNLYFKDQLQLKQGGLLSEFVKLENVCIRLTEERAELIIERSLFGRPFTVSMYLRVETLRDVAGRTTKEVMRDGGDYFKSFPRLKRGGKLGKLEIPQGFLILVMPEFEKLANSMKPEIAAGIEDMPRVTMSKGKILFDPREEGDVNPFGKLR